TTFASRIFPITRRRSVGSATPPPSAPARRSRTIWKSSSASQSRKTAHAPPGRHDRRLPDPQGPDTGSYDTSRRIHRRHWVNCHLDDRPTIHLHRATSFVGHTQTQVRDDACYVKGRGLPDSSSR